MYRRSVNAAATAVFAAVAAVYDDNSVDTLHPNVSRVVHTSVQLIQIGWNISSICVQHTERVHHCICSNQSE